MKAKANCIGGHHHQTSEHSEKTINDKIISTWSVGCLSNLHPEYMRVNSHNHGVACIEIEGEEFYVKNRRILKGRLL